MFRFRIAAALLSAALALGAPAAPARADAEDVAKVLGGLAVIYLLSREFERRDDAPRAARAAPRVARSAPPPVVLPRSPRPVPRAAAPVVAPPDPVLGPGRAPDIRRAAPACARDVHTPEGIRLGYAALCMQERVARPSLLPPNCLEEQTGHRGWYYAPACLAREGWQVAAG